MLPPHDFFCLHLFSRVFLGLVGLFVRYRLLQRFHAAVEIFGCDYVALRSDDVGQGLSFSGRDLADSYGFHDGGYCGGDLIDVLERRKRQIDGTIFARWNQSVQAKSESVDVTVKSQVDHFAREPLCLARKIRTPSGSLIYCGCRGDGRRDCR